MQGWSLEKCLAEYEKLAKDVFGANGVNSILNWVRSFFSGAMYCPDGIEQALKTVYGGQKITDMSYASEVGAKFGLLAASVAQPSVCLFTNYNGVGDARSGYHVPRGFDQVKAWEMQVRLSVYISSANDNTEDAVALQHLCKYPYPGGLALANMTHSYFTPKYIQGLDTFQDAGILQNNPIALALSEFVALHGDDTPDIVVNLGSGSAPAPQLVDSRIRRIRDSWPFRLCRGFMSLMDGLRAWNDVSSVRKKSPKADGHYRLDITIKDLPRLDDTTKLPLLKPMVCNDAKLQKTVREIGYRLFASLFYFELTEVPRRSDSSFTVQGNFLCIRKAYDPALPRIVQRLLQSVIIVNGNKLSSDPVKDLQGSIYQPVSCLSRDSMSIELLEKGNNRPYPISGSPYSIQGLISRCGLTNYFGNSTHKRKAVDVVSTQLSKKRRR